MVEVDGEPDPRPHRAAPLVSSAAPWAKRRPRRVSGASAARNVALSRSMEEVLICVPPLVRAMASATASAVPKTTRRVTSTSRRPWWLLTTCASSTVSGSTSRYMNNWMEQDHRGIKQRYYPLRGFGSFEAAARFCTAHDELRDHLRYRQHMNETMSLADQRRLFQERWGESDPSSYPLIPPCKTPRRK